MTSEKPSPYDFETFEQYRDAFNPRTWNEETKMRSCWDAMLQIANKPLQTCEDRDYRCCEELVDEEHLRKFGYTSDGRTEELSQD